MAVMPALPFGDLLKQLRKRAGMTQRDLAAALGYSDSLISGLEKAQRQPDVETVRSHFIPALGLQDDHAMAVRLLKCAAAARGTRPAAPQPAPKATPPHTIAASSPSVRRLPALPIELIGRSALVNQLSNRLLGHGGRLLTLVGPPGVGKTTLALAVATQVHHHYADGALFVPLATVNDATMMAATLVAMLAPGDVSNKAPAVRVLELLSHQRLLLLLDNLEQIDSAASLIATLLAECPGITILATSRERLHLRAEQRCKVPPLELAAAVALFTQRSQAVDENFALNDENRSTITAICARLDCLPLALELCAAQIELFSSAQLLTQLQAHPLDLLVDGAHDLPPQQRTLRQAIYCSYMLLNERGQALFRALGVFVGGWTREAAEQVADRSQEHSLTFALLHQLVNKSLVIAEKQGELTRYRMLETIRDYAREKLVEQGEEASVCEQHAAYFLQLAEQVRPLLFTTEQQVAYQRLIEEQNNFRAALHWWRTTNQYAGVARLSAALCWFWWKHGNLRTEAHWAEWALKAMACHDTKAPNAIRTKALYAVAFGAQCLGDWARARILYEEYLQIASQPYDFIDFYAVLGELAAVFRMEGDYKQAKILEERRLAWSREHAFPNGVADALMQLGCHAHAQGDLMQARQLLQESLDLRKAVGAITGVAHTQAILGVVAYKQGNLAQSLQLLHETLELCRTLGDKHGTGWTFSDLGVVAQLQQAYEEATHYQHKALALARELGYQHMAALVLGRLGNLALIQNDGERARTYYLESLAVYQQMGFPKPSAVGLEGLAGVAALNSRPRDAAYLLAVAETCHQKIGSVRPLEQQVIHERTVTVARAALSDAQFEAVYLHGRTTALDDAVLPVLTHPTYGK